MFFLEFFGFLLNRDGVVLKFELLKNDEFLEFFGELNVFLGELKECLGELNVFFGDLNVFDLGELNVLNVFL